MAKARFLLFAIAIFAAGSLRSDGDDGWRRTAQGWEHISTWRVRRQVQSPARRVPTAAIGLACFQIVASVLALTLGGAAQSQKNRI